MNDDPALVAHVLLTGSEEVTVPPARYPAPTRRAAACRLAPTCRAVVPTRHPFPALLTWVYLNLHIGLGDAARGGRASHRVGCLRGVDHLGSRPGHYRPATLRDPEGNECCVS